MSQPTLKRKDLHAPFFPSEIFEDYFNPKRKKKGKVKLNFVYYYSSKSSLPASRVGPRQVKLNLEELGDEVEDQVFFSVVSLPYNSDNLSCRKKHLMNAQMQALKLPNQTMTLPKNMTTIMLKIISTMEKEMTWMI